MSILAYCAQAAGVGVILLAAWYIDPRAKTLTIQRTDMGNPVVSTPTAFSVVAKNKAGDVVKDAGIKVAVDQNGGAAVGDDGSDGQFLGSAVGTAVLTATDSRGLTASLTLTVDADNVPASLTIVLGVS